MNGIVDTESKPKSAQKQAEKRLVQAQFLPIGSLFFKEARPHDASGNNKLLSIFPPSKQTLMGAIRSHIGMRYFAKHNLTPWEERKEGEDKQSRDALIDIIGTGDDTDLNKGLGSLTCSYFFLQRENTTYYPAPYCVKQTDSIETEYISLQIDPTHEFETDLGVTCLPQAPAEETRRLHSMHDNWMDLNGWSALLKNQQIRTEHVADESNFLIKHFMTGNEHEKDKRVVIEGMLFTKQHITFKPNVTLNIMLNYPNTITELCDIPLNSNTTYSSSIFLGGERGQAQFELSEQKNILPAFPFTDDEKEITEFTVYLLSPLKVNANSNLPPGFKKNEKGAISGEIHGLKVTLISVCSDKPERVGGWNLSARRPRAVDSYYRAGTAFYFTCEEQSAEVLRDLHGQPFCNNDPWGEGIMLIGKLPKPQSTH